MLIDPGGGGGGQGETHRRDLALNITADQSFGFAFVKSEAYFLLSFRSADKFLI